MGNQCVLDASEDGDGAILAPKKVQTRGLGTFYDVWEHLVAFVDVLRKSTNFDFWRPR